MEKSSTRDSKYKAAHSIQDRRAACARVRDTHPDRVPVVCERADGSTIPELDKSKFLVPPDVTVGQFIVILRSRVHVPPVQAIFVFIGDIVPPNGMYLADLYAKHKDADGFLYMKYRGENTFGATA
jgi:GABA(A) receptor-associated protein